MRLEEVDDFLDANRVMSKESFLRFATQKVNIRYGFQTLQRDDIRQLYVRMSPSEGRADDVTEHQVERAFAAQRKLVDIFNGLDVSQASKVSREEFTQACMTNPGICSLFGINQRAGRKLVVNAMNFEIFPTPQSTHLSFKDVHAYMHTRRQLTMAQVFERLEEFERSQMVLP